MSDIVYKKNGFSTPFLRGYKILRIPIVDADGVSAWPELFPISRIDEMRRTVGARHFSGQMMLEFVSPDRARLDPDSLQFYDDEFDVRMARIGDNKITGACVYWDPSSGRRGHDSSVCVILYRDDKNRNLFVHDVMYLTVADDELHPLARQCEMVLSFLMRYQMRKVMIETNGIGNALPEIMRDIATRQHFPILIGGVTNSRNKEMRILDALEPVMGAGRLYVHRRVTHTPLIAEMLGWTPGGAGHDDGLDALAGAIASPSIPVHVAGHIARPITANTNFKL